MRQKPSSEKQSMMEDSRWSVDSVTKQVVNPSLTCKITFEQILRMRVPYHFCRDHRTIDLGAWEEVSYQEVTACFSQLPSFLTCSICHWRRWSDYSDSEYSEYSDYSDSEYSDLVKDYLTQVGVRPVEGKELSVLGVPECFSPLSRKLSQKLWQNCWLWPCQPRTYVNLRNLWLSCRPQHP